MSDFAQSVKQQADIVKVIEGYIRLRKAGAQNFTGLCPFHQEKTASFNVNATRQFFYCFGCQATGDVFTFVGKIENVSFPESVRIVAQKCGIPLPKREFSSPEEAAEARLRAKLLDLHETAATWFEEQLQGPEGALAREYLAGRGLSAEGIKKFRVGYAPDSYKSLREGLSGMADEETLRASGLFSAKEQGDGTLGPLYDRFRKRVTFPICNEGGRVIAFTARTLETGEKAGPKYLNSPETALYSKGQVLFNLDKAKSVIRQAGFALLVEGQMDCISVYLRGIQNVIATSGTAFTGQQVPILRRHTSNVVVNFDGDTAGENAVEKFADKLEPLIREGFSIRVVQLDPGYDPDRFVRERGVGRYVEAVKGASGLDYFLIERARHLFPGPRPEQKLKQLNFLLPHIRRIPEELVRLQFAANVTQKLEIDSVVMREELRQAALKRRDRVEVKSSALTEVEKKLIRALSITDPENLDSRRLAMEAIAAKPQLFEHLGAFPALQELATRRATDAIEIVTDDTQRGLVALALVHEVHPPPVSEIASAIQELEERAMENRQREVRGLLADATRRGDSLAVSELLKQKIELDHQLRELRNSR